MHMSDKSDEVCDSDEECSNSSIDDMEAGRRTNEMNAKNEASHSTELSSNDMISHSSESTKEGDLESQSASLSGTAGTDFDIESKALNPTDNKALDVNESSSNLDHSERGGGNIEPILLKAIDEWSQYKRKSVSGLSLNKLKDVLGSHRQATMSMTSTEDRQAVQSIIEASIQNTCSTSNNNQDGDENDLSKNSDSMISQDKKIGYRNRTLSITGEKKLSTTDHLGRNTQKQGNYDLHINEENSAKFQQPIRQLSPIRKGVVDSNSIWNTDNLSSTPHQSILNHKVRPTQQPEVHIIGEILYGVDFHCTRSILNSYGLSCKWSFEYGNKWVVLEGDHHGQTHVDFPAPSSKDPQPIHFIWNHPLDIHFVTTTRLGWPRLLLQVWQIDIQRKFSNVGGYGVASIPFSPGEQVVLVPIWRPMGTWREELEATYFRRTPELAADDILFNTAWDDRCRLRTISVGSIHVSVNVILRNFLDV